MKGLLEQINQEIIFTIKIFLRMVIHQIDLNQSIETAIALEELAAEIRTECRPTAHD